MEPYTLKALAEGGIERALAKAEQYRALNEPEDAESICRDVLATAPGHQEATVLLGLALTDQFPQAWSRLFDEALRLFKGLDGEYERAYYAGIAWERCAKAQLDQSQARNALHSFERALGCFEEAERLADGAVPDPVLRWNRCVRALQGNASLVAALREAREPAYEMGD